MKTIQEFVNESKNNAMYKLETDAEKPTPKGLTALLKANNVKMQRNETQSGIHYVTLIGTLDNLTQVLLDDEHGWGDEDLIDGAVKV
jgi:hypothetical protein